MREFKFIRGIYKDENIFSTAEKSSCLFAYDKNGKIVDFDTKNKEEFQKRFVDLSKERLSEIYTLKPNQFTVSATGVPGKNYSFNFTANTNVEDGSIEFPTEVKTNAEKNLNENTIATFNTFNSKPMLNLTGKAAEKTGVTFAFGGKTFTRNLVFNVTGHLKERGYTLADGAVDKAYPTDENGVIDFGNDGDTAIENKTFNSGFLQQEVSPTQKTVISTKEITVTDQNYNNLDIAMSYIPGDGFKLVLEDSQIVNSLDYNDTLNFFLYSKTATQNDDSVIDNDITYYRVGKCTVTSRSDTTIVKNYEKSYENNYIFDSSTGFTQVGIENLSGDSINVYIGNEYNIIDGHVYENDHNITTEYVMFSNVWTENKDITNENAYVNEKGVVSPLITDNIFRQITSVNVTATQSD